MQISFTRRFSAVALAALAFLAAGCGDDPVSPGLQPQVVNDPDNFEYQVSDVQNYSGTVTYTWPNTGTQATVNQSTTVGDGSLTLVLLDASGTQVYSRSLSENGTFTSAVGTPGNWTVRIVYNETDATVNFRADKTT